NDRPNSSRPAPVPRNRPRPRSPVPAPVPSPPLSDLLCSARPRQMWWNWGGFPATEGSAKMNDRVRAMTILQEAREIVAKRLTARIIELGDDLLDDARGESFGGEIDALYDELGLKMSQLNALI